MRTFLTSRVSTSALARVSTSLTCLALFRICPRLKHCLFPFGSAPSSFRRFRQTDSIGPSQDLARARSDLEPFLLPNLEELVVDLLGTNKPFPLKSFLTIFSLFEDAPLTSLAICGRSQTIPALPLASYELLINQHAKTLRRVVLVKANIPNIGLESICKACKRLEIIGVPVPSAADLVCDLRLFISRNWLLSGVRDLSGRSGCACRGLLLSLACYVAGVYSGFKTVRHATHASSCPWKGF